MVVGRFNLIAIHRHRDGNGCISNRSGIFGMLINLAKLYEPDGVRVKSIEMTGKSFAKGGLSSDYLQCPVSFGNEKNRMVLHAPGAQSTARGQNRFLWDFFNAKAEEEVAQLHVGHKLSAKVENLLADEIAQGNFLCSDASPLLIVCERMQMSRWNLQRRLSSEGENFQSLLQRVRLREARRQLVQPGVMVADISDSLGFSSVSVFSRFFSEMSGMSPTKFRQIHETGSH